VDVLSMSATPIPRTLFISLSGIRQISVIKTPPKNRKPIVTKVEQYNDSKIIEYIRRELKRGGQVYFLHNDVKTIQAKNKKLKKLLLEARISFAHGQMSENDLATVMAGFAAGDIDILVCSTIIENGLDIPQANTLIIEDADRFGLSQLYQLRGRLGRASRPPGRLEGHVPAQGERPGGLRSARQVPGGLDRPPGARAAGRGKEQ